MKKVNLKSKYESKQFFEQADAAHRGNMAEVRKIFPEGLREMRMVDEGKMSSFGNLGEMPAKRSSAREFLVEALKEDEVAKGGNTFSDFVTKEDVKYITEGGGGIAGDPLVLVNKYFGC